MIELNPEQRRALRAAAHHLHPVVGIGQHGLTDTVAQEIDRSLIAHELIKVKVHGIERGEREILLAEICDRLKCAPVQHIGNILVLWRPRPDDIEPTNPPARPRGKPLTKKQAAAAAEKPRRRSMRPGVTRN